MSEGHSISVPRTVRFFVAGDPRGAFREAWFVLHGYGQLADGFLEEFAGLADGSRLIVAPEGLSRFYQREGSGPVGASWMTKLAREDEIGDYVRYLDAVYAQLLGAVAPHDVRVHALGFSQGAATAFRWTALGVSRVDRLTLWAGGVPPDLDLARHRERLERVELTLVVGERDEFLDERRVAAEAERLRSAGLAHRLVSFAGGHRLDDATLARLADGG